MATKPLTMTTCSLAARRGHTLGAALGFVNDVTSCYFAFFFGAPSTRSASPLRVLRN